MADSETACHLMDTQPPAESREVNIEELISEGSLDFDDWTSLISYVEKAHHDEVDKISFVYDSFLSQYPLCHGYWRKYAGHMMRLCTIEKVLEVFERAVQAATYCVGMWVDYCKFSMSVFENPSAVRRLFRRAMSYVGKDYLCHTLWDTFIEYEHSQQQWSALAHLYITAMRFPTKKLHHYYNRFKRLVNVWKKGKQTDPAVNSEVPASDDNIFQIVKDILDPSNGLDWSNALYKYIYIGEQFYINACQLNEKILSFESRIKRPYYHVKPLDDSQLDNWHKYLDFVEMQDEFDWAVKVYERCLISCANYPEFWMRYVEFMEAKGGREIANFALDRATKIFVKRVPAIHHFYARFKEQIRDVQGVRSSLFFHTTELDPDFVERVITKANTERRLGNLMEASNIYEEALKLATASGKSHALPMLYVHFSRFTYTTTNSVDAARDILIDGIKNMPACKLLLEELIKSAMIHGASNSINVINSIIDDTLLLPSDLSVGFSEKDKQDISTLYLEFVDLCGTIQDGRKAWNRHIRMFPHTVRCTSHMQSDSDRKALIRALRQGQGTVLCRSYEQPLDAGYNGPIQFLLQDNSLPLQKDDVTQSHWETTDHEPNKKSKLPKNHDIQPGQTTIAPVHTFKLGDGSQGLQHTCSENLETFKKENAEQKVTSKDLSPDIGNKTNTAQVLQDCPKENDSQLEQEIGSKQSLNPLPLEKHTLDPQEERAPGSAPSTSQECRASPDCMSNLSMQGSKLNTNEDCDTNRDLFDDNSIGSQTPDFHCSRGEIAIPSLLGHERSGLTQPRSHGHVPGNSTGGWHQMNNSNKVRRDSKYGFHGHSNRRLRHRQFPHRKHPQFEKDTQMPTSRGYSAQTSSLQQVQQGSQLQNPCQPSTSGTDVTVLMQNVQQQNVSTGQIQPPTQSVSYPYAEMPQQPMQSNEQYNQAYQQMWQYYYYQQQFLLQQLPQLQSQLTQQQPLPQQHYPQQQLVQPPTLQQQPQSNELQHLQFQEHPYMQQVYQQQLHSLGQPQQEPQELDQHVEQAELSETLVQRKQGVQNECQQPVDKSEVQ